MPGPRSTVAERVDYCAWLMARGEWADYLTRIELARAWNVSDSAVKSYSAEAHRMLARDPQALDELRASHAAFCERIKREAASKRSHVTGLPDYGAALKAAELAAKFQGIELEPKAPVGAVALRIIVDDAGDPTPPPNENDPDAGGTP